MTRSWLFGPGHNERILAKVFDCAADEVLLDLEDAVPLDLKQKARAQVREVLTTHPAWVRINRAGTELAAADLASVAGLARGIRLPKVESAAEVAWTRERAPGLPITATIESALGILAGLEIARSGIANLAYGGADLAVDLNIDEAGEEETLYARSHLVVVSAAAGIEPPSDGVHTSLQDDDGLRRAASRARRLGFFGKSAIHPRQVPIINEVFAATPAERAWAEAVLAAFERSGGAATRLEDGTFIDIPIAERARRLLATA